MNFLIFLAAFAVYHYFLRPTISPTVIDNVKLLLPGFQGRVLQAGLIEEVRVMSGFLFCSSPFPG